MRTDHLTALPRVLQSAASRQGLLAGLVGWLGRLDNGCASPAFTSVDRTTPFVGTEQTIDLVFTTFVRS